MHRVFCQIKDIWPHLQDLHLHNSWTDTDSASTNKDTIIRTCTVTLEVVTIATLLLCDLVAVLGLKRGQVCFLVPPSLDFQPLVLLIKQVCEKDDNSLPITTIFYPFGTAIVFNIAWVFVFRRSFVYCHVTRSQFEGLKLRLSMVRNVSYFLYSIILCANTKSQIYILRNHFLSKSNVLASSKPDCHLSSCQTKRQPINFCTAMTLPLFASHRLVPRSPRYFRLVPRSPRYFRSLRYF